MKNLLIFLAIVLILYFVYRNTKIVEGGFALGGGAVNFGDKEEEDEEEMGERGGVGEKLEKKDGTKMIDWKDIRDGTNGADWKKTPGDCKKRTPNERLSLIPPGDIAEKACAHFIQNNNNESCCTCRNPKKVTKEGVETYVADSWCNVEKVDLDIKEDVEFYGTVYGTIGHDLCLQERELLDGVWVRVRKCVGGSRDPGSSDPGSSVQCANKKKKECNTDDNCKYVKRNKTCVPKDNKGKDNKGKKKRKKCNVKCKGGCITHDNELTRNCCKCCHDDSGCADFRCYNLCPKSSMKHHTGVHKRLPQRRYK